MLKVLIPQKRNELSSLVSLQAHQEPAKLQVRIAATALLIEAYCMQAAIAMLFPPGFGNANIATPMMLFQQ
jgi:hypothetical protein